MNLQHKDIFGLSDSDSESSIISIISDEITQGSDEFDLSILDEDLPILPLRNTILFPGNIIPISVGRESSKKLISTIQRKSKKRQFVGLFCQTDGQVENPKKDDLYKIGTVGEIVRVIELPDADHLTVLFSSQVLIKLDSITQSKPFLKGKCTFIPEVLANKKDTEFKALMDSISELMFQMLKLYGEPPKEFVTKLKSKDKNFNLLNFCCSSLPVSVAERQELLEITSEKSRAYKLLTILNREIQMMEMKVSIQMKTREELNQQQKEYFLQQQIRTIQDELGGNPQQGDIDEFKKKAEKKKWNEETQKIFDKELTKLERLNNQSPEYSTQFNYIETFLNLPWHEFSKDNFDLAHAQKILDQDHFGLEKVKERIIEHLAVLKLKGDLKSPIICLYGPPGVGKTSLGKSVAKALNRKYVRVALGGVHDESEIRGHRRTYIGAMPGRIIQNMIKAGKSNPVFVLDEIDKLGKDVKGDPSSALLEVLDPEQNSTFHDNYINVDFDLSKVLFLATANDVGNIPQPLLDRMEMIDISGYIMEEKVEIAKQHLIPNQIKNHGLKKSNVNLPKDTIEKIIQNYTRESGVRGLDKKIAAIMRKIARKVAAEETYKKTINPPDLEEYLGVQLFSRDKYQGNDYAGVVTGLAWTSVGGEILFIETSLSKGKGSKLTLTGNLGEVMKESALLAVEYLRSHADILGINEEIFDHWNIHIHVPEGAIPKDGPSAGITMVTSIASALTQRKVKPNLAMTGEITLRGKVLPVGGIKEKILASKRAGITDIILCEENRKNVLDIKENYLEGLNFHYVDNIKQVLEIALLQDKIDNPMDISVQKKEKKESEN